jgi:hypothetical protein
MATPENILDLADEAFENIASLQSQVQYLTTLHNTVPKSFLIQPEAGSTLRQHSANHKLADVSGPKATITLDAAQTVMKQTEVAALLTRDDQDAGLVSIYGYQPVLPPCIHPLDTLVDQLAPLRTAARVCLDDSSRFSHSGTLKLEVTNPSESFMAKPFGSAPRVDPLDVSARTELTEVGLQGAGGIMTQSLAPTDKVASMFSDYLDINTPGHDEHLGLRSANSQADVLTPPIAISVEDGLRVDSTGMDTAFSVLLPESPFLLAPRKRGLDGFQPYNYGVYTNTLLPATLSVTEEPGSTGGLLIMKQEGGVYNMTDGFETQVRNLMSLDQIESDINKNVVGATEIRMVFTQPTEGIISAGLPDFTIVGGLDTSSYPGLKDPFPVFASSAVILEDVVGTRAQRNWFSFETQTTQATLQLDDLDTGINIQNIVGQWQLEEVVLETTLAATNESTLDVDSKLAPIDNRITWSLNSAELRAAANNNSLRDYHQSYELDVIKNRGEVNRKNDLGVLQSTLSADTWRSEVGSLLSLPPQEVGAVRISNLKPAELSVSSPALVYPLPLSNPASVPDPAAEWEALAPGEASITGTICNSRAYSVLMQASVNQIPTVLSHKWTDTRSDASGNASAKLKAPTITKLYPDLKQTGVPPRNVADGEINIELTMIEGTRALPSFTVQAIERGKSSNDHHIDGAETENRSLTFLDDESSSRSIRYVFREGAEAEDLNNLMYVEVSIMLAQINGFVKFSPKGSSDDGVAWAQAWRDLMESPEHVLVEISTIALRCIAVDFYEYAPGTLDEMPLPDTLTSINMPRQYVAASWSGVAAKLWGPCNAGQVGLDNPDHGLATVGLSFVGTGARHALPPGTKIYGLFGNSPDFTYDIDFITEPQKAVTKQADGSFAIEWAVTDDTSTYSARDLTATLARIPPPGGAGGKLGEITLQGLSEKIDLYAHIGGGESMAFQIATIAQIEFYRRVLNSEAYAMAETLVSLRDGFEMDDVVFSDGEVDKSSHFFWDGADISPYNDGLHIAFGGNFMYQEEATTVEQVLSAATLAGALAASSLSAPATFSIGGEDVFGLTLGTQVRGFLSSFGSIAVEKDKWTIGNFGSLGLLATGYTTAGVAIDLPYGGTITPDNTHSTLGNAVTFRYACSTVQIDDMSSSELNGNHVVDEFVNHPKYGNELGDIFQNSIIFRDPLMEGVWTMQVTSDVLSTSTPAGAISSVSIAEFRSEMFGEQIDVLTDYVAPDIDVYAPTYNFLPCRLPNSGVSFPLSLLPVTMRAYSPAFTQFDGSIGVNELVVINASLPTYYVIGIASVLDMSSVNQYDLNQSQVMCVAFDESQIELKVLGGGDGTSGTGYEYVSFLSQKIPLAGRKEFQMLRNPSVSMVIKNDPSAELVLKSRNLPRNVEIPIQGGKYKVARYTQSAGNYVMSAQSGGFNLDGQDIGTIVPISDWTPESDNRSTNVEIRILADFFTESDLYEGFSFSFDKIPEPLMIAQTRFYELDEFGTRTELPYDETTPILDVTTGGVGYTQLTMGRTTISSTAVADDVQIVLSAVPIATDDGTSPVTGI